MHVCLCVHVGDRSMCMHTLYVMKINHFKALTLWTELQCFCEQMCTQHLYNVHVYIHTLYV